MCPECKQSFDSSRGLGIHYYHNKEHRPTLTDKQNKIIIGLLMGDGSINKSGTPRLAVTSINLDYLSHLEKSFGGLATSTFLEKTAEECAKINRTSGFSPNASSENYSDLYKFQTRASPEFSKYLSWYQSGTKVWPGNIELSPTVLKHWYAGDGNLDNGRIRISLSNERGNEKKISKYFENVNLPTPDRWGSNETHYNENMKVSYRAIWSKQNSKNLLEYMGSPPPGFEYKWN